MTKPRYSIIPGGAVTDQRLEPRDLHVLCFLGIHTDKLGWCFLTQGKIAKALDCSRASVQRSLARLAEFEWIEVRSSASAMTRAHACHAYRVRMDCDDPAVEPSELEVDEQERERGCPPVNTPAHTGWARVPNKDGHGGAHTYVGTEGPSTEDSVFVSARARVGYSDDAAAIAEQIAELAKVDTTKDAKWFQAGPAIVVQRFLDAGYLPWHLIDGVKRAMLVRTSAPRDINYFKPLWQRVRGEAESTAPPPTAPEIAPQKPSQAPRPGSREDRQERTTNARRKLREWAYGPHADGEDRSGQDGGPISGGLRLPKPA